MGFDVPADAYDRFMGRYSRLLPPPLPPPPQRAHRPGGPAAHRPLGVGCGPGSLTGELVSRLGPGAVAAVDPSEPFVAAASSRFPDVDVRRAAAQRLPLSR